MALNTSLLRYGGDVAVGAYTVIISIRQMESLPLMGLAQGAQPIISFNYGAGNQNRVKQSARLLFLCCAIFRIVFWMSVMLFPKILISVFSNDPPLIDITVWAARIFLFGSFATGIQTCFQQSFLALGQAKASLLLALLRKIFLLIPLIYLLPLFFSNKLFGVFVAEPIADILAASITATCFLIWTKKHLLEKKAPSKG